MTRLPLFCAALATLAATASAQCPGASAGLVPWDNFFGYAGPNPVTDEGLSSPPIQLTAFANFPMPGAVGNLDQLWVHSNGELYLTDSTLGLTEPVDGITFGIISLAELQGAVGGSARIAVCAADQDASQVSGANWSVTVDQTFPGEVRILWTDIARWSNFTDRYSFQCTLFSSGVMRFDYDANVPAAARWVGVSVGNMEPSSSGSQDLTTLPASALTEGILYETFTAGTWDLSGQSVLLNPDFTPGIENYSAVAVLPYATGPCATHSPYGTGCYPIARESFYQLFADAATASAALQGNSMTVTPTANGYSAAWNAGGASSFVTPVLPTDLTLTDDGQQLLDLTLLGLSALPIPGGATTTLYVHANGFISTGIANDNGNWNIPPTDYTPTSWFRNAPETAFWSWHDFNPAEPGSGPVRWHHDPALNILYVTWDGTENYSTPVALNPSTIQFQFHLNTGRVDYVWLTIDTDTTSTFGTAHLIGYSPGGTSLDPGSITLATALPLATAPDISAMSLSASPRPVINPSTPVTYTASNLVEFQPSSGVYLSTMFLSVNPLPGGFDVLGILTNTPGCSAYIVTLDLDLGAQLTFAPTATWNITYDNVNFAPGNVVAGQAVALFDGAFPLANGENGGFLLSNGVQSTTQTQ